MKSFLQSMMIIFLLSFINGYSQPKLEIQGGETYDWKKVSPKDSPLKTTIDLKNTGNEKLIINSVKPSCGCTAVLLDKNEVQPGQSAKLDIKLNLPGRPGPVVKSVSISSNDPSKQMVNLYLKAEVFVEIEVSPGDYFNFDQLKLGVESVAKVKLINHSGKRVTFTDFSVEPDYVKVNLSKELVLKPNEEYEITARVKPDKKGYFGCLLKMKTSHPEYPEIKIQGSAVVSDTVSIQSGQK